MGYWVVVGDVNVFVIVGVNFLVGYFDLIVV